MCSWPAKYYAHWRARDATTPTLRDNHDAPPERLLQAIWQHQRLRRDQLSTLDGQPLRVLHPGFVSVEGGPDFRGAMLRLGAAQPVSGDVELDVRAASWLEHGHAHNPAFEKVVLHVIWDGEHCNSNRPTIALKTFLDAPLLALASEYEHDSIRSLPAALQGKCCAPLQKLDAPAGTELLWQAALVRLHLKADQFANRARQAGWEQALWEGLFRALGYKHNTWPMQHLAECRKHWLGESKSVAQIQARLLGLSGLLPTELLGAKKGADEYVRQVWDYWWRDQDEFATDALPRSTWRFHGLRPANHPQRRLALAAHWLCRKGFVAQIEQWCQPGAKSDSGLLGLTRILATPTDDFWSWHWTLNSARLPKPQPLLGPARTTDLAINVVLPWLMARAIQGDNARLAQEIESRYRAWPASEDNAVLKLARQRLLGGNLRRHQNLKTAAAQQGLLQIVRDFCAQSNAICEGCQFPELVDGFQKNGIQS